MSTALKGPEEQVRGDSKPLLGAGGLFCFLMAAQHSQREVQRGSFELRDTEAHPGARVQGHIVRAVEPGFEPVWPQALLRPLAPRCP